MHGYLSAVVILTQVCMTTINLRIGVMRKNKTLSSHCHASILVMISFSKHWSEQVFQCCYKLYRLYRPSFVSNSQGLFIKITLFPFLLHKMGTINRGDNKICIQYWATFTDYSVSITKMRTILSKLEAGSEL